jgi:hypothetical protein
MFSGVQKLVAVYKDQHQIMQAVIKTQDKSEPLHTLPFERELNKLRSEKADFTWFDESSLPFRVKQSGIFQQDIFNELEKTVLLLRIASQQDGKRDLLFVYFDKNLSHLALAHQNENKLGGDLKPLIAKLLHNSVTSVIKDAQSNQEILKHNFNPGTQNIIQSHKQLQSDYNELKIRFHSNFEKLVKSIYYRYLDKSKYSITLSSLALEKLMTYQGNFDEIEAVIKSSIAYISTLYMGDLPEQLHIEDYFISLNAVKAENKEENNRYSKTIDLLDKLNDAVKKVVLDNHNPTGANVGKAMSKPISAPAISDALKNHKSKILTLIDRYPNRWTELKQYFKPIQNLSLNQSLYNEYGT